MYNLGLNFLTLDLSVVLPSVWSSVWSCTSKWLSQVFSRGPVVEEMLTRSPYIGWAPTPAPQNA